MVEVFIGSRALACGGLTRARLRWRNRTLFPDVYLDKHIVPSLRQRIVGAWLWSGERGIIAGRAAAALHGARWVAEDTPIEMIWTCGRPPPGLIVRNERIHASDVISVDGMLVTTAERTAFDLARHLPRDLAVAHLDALARATGIAATDVLVLADRYPRARGLPRARNALPLLDGGAQSPQETRLRLILIDDGLPAPRTQIKVSDGVNHAFIDMGYDDPRLGFDYEGAHHSEVRGQYVHDIGRAEFIESRGWLDIRVVAEHSRRFILYRAHNAFERRGWTPPKLQ
jgi:hypothetical protein